MSVMTPHVINGRHVLIGLLAFFAIVIAANGAFVFLALDSWTGLTTEDAYRKGLTYNETLRAADAQQNLGWRASHRFEPLGGRRGQLEITLHDQRGAPLENLTVTATLRRPAREGLDRDVTLARQGPGTYGAAIALPLAGQWDVVLRAVAPSDARYRVEDRIWLK